MTQHIRLVLAVIAAISIGAAAQQTDLLRGVAGGATRLVDLSYAINGTSPAWPGDDHPFTATTVATFAKDGYFARSFSMLEHYETHMDAPAHFAAGQPALDQIPASHFFGPAVVIDVAADVARNADYRLTPQRVQQWETAHGKIPSGAIVLLRTGWSARWPDQTRYRNMDAKSVMHFPGYSVEAARLLMSRGVVGLGIDTLSIDYGPSKNFEVHHVNLPAGLYNLENVANLGQLPESGAWIVAAPIKLEGGSGGPVRIFGLAPKG